MQPIHPEKSQPELVFVNEKQYQKNLEKVQFFFKAFESVIDSYNQFNIGKFNPTDFEALICRTTSFIDEKVYQSKDLSALSSLGLSKMKLADLIEKPAGYEALISKTDLIVREFKAKDMEAFFFINLKEFLKCFIIDEESKLKIDSEFVAGLKEQQSSYVTSEKAKMTFYFGRDLVELYKKYNIPVHDRMANTNFIRDLIDFEMEVPVLNPNAVMLVEHYARS